MVAEKKCGECGRPDAEYVKLVSSDEQEFYIKRELAVLSGTIKSMLSGRYEEDESNVVYFQYIPSHVLHIVCQYLSYKHDFITGSTQMPEFNIHPKMALELFMAANFFDC
ncbi:hypothetical protein QR680_007875 [Steinernema hermaphroditum]|uniref:Elongin-C n=1 Tax=Steinernema hermaphroditum TaxID=289476 RepID=A0AA39M732_9BILA|nr:hypothetical protein QR680_007875 [Steinernema hermaphroditum]